MGKKRKANGSPSNQLHPSKKHTGSSTTLRIESHVDTASSENPVDTKNANEFTTLNSVHVPSALSSSKPASKGENGHKYQQYQSDLPDLPIIQNPKIAEAPFNHSGTVSASNYNQDSTPINYERLEFLGDAYIEVIASRIILQRFSNFSAGKLSQTRELLVRNERLAIFSRQYGFDTRARLPPEIQRKKGADDKKWIKVLGDIFEAYVAAVIISDPANGFAIAEKWLSELWEPLLLKEVNPQEADIDAKQALATRIMTNGTKIEYHDDGPPEKSKTKGQEVYHIRVCFTGLDSKKYFLGTGKGPSKKAAGQEAARKALQNPQLAKLVEAKKLHDAEAKAQKQSIAAAKEVEGD
ncbi:MAG: hypothetical protein Q9222_007719 [Ikaeria aurantiellina]